MDYILGFVILLGVLIAIHEFGHFIVAKACGVRVETFSIGIGKKILSITRGETEYALSVFPLGGYVKLTGQDPREEVPPELESKSFRHKPLYQRAAVVLAGPAFNALLAVILMTVLYSAGAPSPEAVIERVEPGSPAAAAGFVAGDRVRKITTEAGKNYRIRELSELEEAVANHVGSSLSFEIERSDAANSHQNLTLHYTPELGATRDPTIGVMKKQGVINGVEYRSLLPIVTVSSPQSWAAQRKVPSTFWIQELRYPIEGIEQVLQVQNLDELHEAWHTASLSQQRGTSGQILIKGQKIVLKEENAKDKSKADAKEPETLSFTMAWTQKNDHAPDTLEAAGLMSHEFVILSTKEGSPAEKLGLKSGDIITQLNDKTVHSFNTFKDSIQNLARVPGQKITLNWLRDGKNTQASITPEVVSVTDPLTETKSAQFQIGAAFLPMQNDPRMIPLKADNLFDALGLGVCKSYALTNSMLKSFYHLFVGNIALKTLGGPILIGKIAGESFRRGWTHFVRMMAFISLNLFVLNLLPIPVLDGGHLILYIVEAARRKPLSTKIVEAWSTTGFFILMGLVAIVFFNDLSRLGLFKFFSS